jgi:hypothetical protein
MSCLGPGYNPNPPRAWSRVQSQCSYNLNPPTSGQPINFNIYQQENQMLLKGNILQYKKNSSSLTKKQRYSQIAKGLWTNRTKTWASQSQTSTNPNISSLQRVNYAVIPLIDPITDSFGCTINFLKDGGSLVCNTYVNPCTDEVIEKTRTNQCNMSSASDVPGPEVPLCWDNRVQTWYPRQNLTMNNSGNKWPVNYKLFKSSNSLVSGTEVSQDFLYGTNVDSSTRKTNTLNNFNINNIYSTTASLASININLFTSYYNEFMNNNIITQINGYLKTFVGNPTGISMSVTQYNNMNMGLTSLKTNVSTTSALYDIISKYTLMLDTLYQSNSLNSSLQGTTSSLEKYKLDSEILNDVSQLQKYLDDLNNTYNIFETITVNSIETATVSEPYNAYNLTYGIPPDLAYDPEKLLSISQSLGI